MNNKPEIRLSKRLLVRLARQSIAQAATETMALMGYNVIARNGWVIRKYADGRVEAIAKIPGPAFRGPVRLDQ